MEMCDIIARYFDFEAHDNSPDVGFLARDDEAFAFKPLMRRFHKFRLYVSRLSPTVFM